MRRHNRAHQRNTVTRWHQWFDEYHVLHKITSPLPINPPPHPVRYCRRLPELSRSIHLTQIARSTSRRLPMDSQRFGCVLNAWLLPIPTLSLSLLCAWLVLWCWMRAIFIDMIYVVGGHGGDVTPTRARMWMGWRACGWAGALINNGDPTETQVCMCFCVQHPQNICVCLGAAISEFMVAINLICEPRAQLQPQPTTTAQPQSLTDTHRVRRTLRSKVNSGRIFEHFVGWRVGCWTLLKVFET